MADLDDKADGTRQLDPEDVSTRTFPTAFRGFDPVKVRAFLGTVADELRRLRSRLRRGHLRRCADQMVTVSAAPFSTLPRPQPSQPRDGPQSCTRTGTDPCAKA